MSNLLKCQAFDEVQGIIDELRSINTSILNEAVDSGDGWPSEAAARLKYISHLIDTLAYDLEPDEALEA